MSARSKRRGRIFGSLIVIATMILASGCVGLPILGLVGGSAIAIDMSRDHRSVGTYVNDNVLESKISNEIRSDATLAPQVHVNTTVINGVVLLTGEAPNQANIDHISDIAHSFKHTRKVVNRVELAGATTLTSRANDTWITMEVKSALYHAENVEHLRVKVVTERGNVYLMGLVSAAEAEAATEVARSVKGVARVVKVFEYY